MSSEITDKTVKTRLIGTGLLGTLVILLLATAITYIIAEAEGRAIGAQAQINEINAVSNFYNAFVHGILDRAL